MIRRSFATLIALSLGLSLLAPASAGGWATVELIDDVAAANVGDVVVFNIIIRQHGVTPAKYPGLVFTAVHAESGESLSIDAEKLENTGVFAAEVTFDQPGRWKLRGDVPAIGTGASFPTIDVGEAGDDGGTPEAETGGSDDVVAIDIVGGVFTPSIATIESGTTVRFTNQDSIKHEVAFADVAIDDSGILDTGESFEFTFEQDGKFLFVCGPHPGMTGYVEVGTAD